MTFTIRVALVLSLLCPLSGARAETNDCTNITSLPAIINAPGIYCLKQSLSMPSASGIGITVVAPNVRIDLNGHTLDGAGAGPSSATAIVGFAVAENIHVLNGTIRGFGGGVSLGSPLGGHLVEGLRIDRNNSSAIYVEGRGNIVRDNQLIATGDGIGNAWGIAVHQAPGSYIADNRIVETVEGTISWAMAIEVVDSPGVAVERNFISNTAWGVGTSVGILVSNSPHTTVVDNRIANMKRGIEYQAAATGLYMDNTVSGAQTPYAGGTAAGATNFSF